MCKNNKLYFYRGFGITNYLSSLFKYKYVQLLCSVPEPLGSLYVDRILVVESHPSAE